MSSSGMERCVRACVLSPVVELRAALQPPLGPPRTWRRSIAPSPPVVRASRGRLGRAVASQLTLGVCRVDVEGRKVDPVSTFRRLSHAIAAIRIGSDVYTHVSRVDHTRDSRAYGARHSPQSGPSGHAHGSRDAAPASGLAGGGGAGAGPASAGGVGSRSRTRCICNLYCAAVPVDWLWSVRSRVSETQCGAQGRNIYDWTGWTRTVPTTSRLLTAPRPRPCCR